ncbi:MAG: antitoxin [Promethearchaeota archaeon]|nr:MAG: antitoxin [Candidatus Lokiarchaeota archaeon]
MTQKTVSLSEEAYEKLRRVKKEGESFSQVIIRLIKRDENVSVLDFAGSFSEGSKEWESIEKEIYNRRKEKSRVKSLMED